MASDDSNAANAAIQRELGGLTTAVKGIQNILEKSDEKSDESRKEVRKSLEDLKDRTTQLEHQHEELLEDINEMRPIVDEVQQWKQRGLGALGVVGRAATALGITIVNGWETVKNWLVGIFN